MKGKDFIKWYANFVLEFYAITVVLPPILRSVEGELNRVHRIMGKLSKIIEIAVDEGDRYDVLTKRVLYDVGTRFNKRHEELHQLEFEILCYFTATVESNQKFIERRQ